MASGMDWLSALLLGGGTFAKQVGDAGEFTRQERLKQEQLRIDQQRADQLMELQKNQLAQQESQFQRGREPSAKDLLPYLMEAKGKAAAAEREQASRIGQATVLERLGAARPAEMGGALAPGEDPEAAAMIPRTEGAPANQRLQSIAALLKEGPLAEYLVKALGDTQEEFAPISEGSPGLYGKRSGATRMFPAGPTPEQSPQEPGTVRSTTTDWRNRKSTTDKPIEATNMADRLAQSEQFGGYDRFEVAPPPVKRAILAEEQRLMVARGAAGAQARQGVEMAGPIGKEADNFTDPKTLEPARPGMPKEFVYNNYLSVPQKAVQSYKTLGQTLAEAEDVIKRRDDLFPPASKNYASDVFNVGGAMAQYWATKKTDPDVRVIQGLQATIPLQVRTFGDVGNIAVAEREIATNASGLGGPSTKEAALASINLIRRLVNESGSAASLPPLESLTRGKVGNSGRDVLPQTPGGRGGDMSDTEMRLRKKYGLP